MAAHTVSAQGTANIRASMQQRKLTIPVIDKSCADPKTTIPGFVAVAVNKEGKVIFSHASGKTGSENSAPATLDSVFWIASCTKMIGGIACMQLVEQGKLALDDADLAEKLCPELAAVKILTGFDENDQPILKAKRNRITLRMLLSHTAGFGYSFFNHEIRKYAGATGIDEFSGSTKDFDSPLLFEPGTKFNYGSNIDWAGFMVERVTGLSLNDYCHKYIFEPLNLKYISMFPSDEMKATLMHMNQRYPDGHMVTRPHLQRAPLITKRGDPQQKNIANSAGAGAFARPTDYVQIIATLLNNGTSPTTGKQILQPATVDEMFRNQIPNLPNFGREPIDDAIPELTNKISELYPQPADQPQGWGLTFMLTISPGATGRGANTGWWAGLPNLFWWADRERGVGGMVASQILPFADPQVMGLWANVEALIYQG